MTPLEFVEKARHVLKTVPVEELLPAHAHCHLGSKARCSETPDDQRGGCLIQRVMGWGAKSWDAGKAEEVADGFVDSLAIASDDHKKDVMLATLKQIEKWAKDDANASRSRK